MQIFKAPKRYAKALLFWAKENNKIDDIFAEMTKIHKMIDQNIELERLLSSPIVKSVVKKNVLDEVFADSSKEIKQFFSVLIENKRLGILKAIAKDYINLYKEYNQEQTAVVTTAIEISEGLKQKFLEKIKQETKNPKIEVEYKVNPGIIGGFVLRVGDTQYNASVLNKLFSVEKNFAQLTSV